MKRPSSCAAWISLVLLGCMVVWMMWQPVSDPRNRDTGPRAERPAAALSGQAAAVLGEWWKAAEADGRVAENEWAEGLQLARSRRAALEELARRHPEAARARLMDLAQLAALPEAIRRECEQPWSAVADLDLLWETTLSEDGTLHCEHRHVVRGEGFALAAVGVSLQEPLPPLRQAYLQGHRLGDTLLLDASPLRILSAAEAEVADLWFAGPADSSGSVQSILGGRVEPFASQEEAEILMAEITSAEKAAREARSADWTPPARLLAADQGGGGGTVEATPYLPDHIRVLFIRVDFSDFAGEVKSISRSDLQSTLDTVAAHVNQYSYGAASLQHTVSETLYRMPATGASYATAGNNDGIINAARNLAAAHYNLANYEVVAVYFPSLSGVSGSKITYGGLASVGGGNHWINGTNNVGVILHEFGHNYGLFHSNYWNPAGTLGGARYDDAGASLEYGDVFDRMGSGTANEGYFSPYSTHRLQWLPESKAPLATANGTWRIHRFDHPAATSNTQLALRVPMGGGVTYWVGHRRAYGAPYNTAAGAYVVAEGLYEYRPNLIDMTPGSQATAVADRNDCALVAGAEYHDAIAGVRIRTLQAGGTAPNEWIDVSVTFESRIELAKSVIEVDEMAGNARIVLRRLFGGDAAASVAFSTQPGSATAGLDYHPVSGTLHWAAGETGEKTIQVPLRPDSLAEGVETFQVLLANPQGAVISPGSSAATVSILDPGRRFNSFAPPFFNTAVNAVIPLPDGKTLIGGVIGAGIGTVDGIRHIARLHADGSVDESFLSGTGFNGVVHAMLRQPDGKILVGGEFTRYDGIDCNRLIRLLPDGSPDTAFLTQMGSGASSTVFALGLENDGGILVGGSFGTFKGQTVRRIIRLNSAGAPDSTRPLAFDPDWDISEVRAILPLADGRFFLGGTLYYSAWEPPPVDGFRSGIALFLANGSRDAGFEPGAGAHTSSSRYSLASVTCLARQSDGKILVGGHFTAFNGSAATRFVRLNPNGSVDSGFGFPSMNANPRSILVQPSGRIAVAGHFTTPGAYLVRFRQDGTPCDTWNPGGAPSAAVYTLATAADGAIVAGGNFFQYAGNNSRPVIRLAGGGGDRYDLWAQQSFALSGLAASQQLSQADPDGDQRPNLLEMATGGNPLAASSAAEARESSRLARVGGEDFLEITLPKGPAAEGLWITGQFTGQLSSWPATSPVPGAGGAAYTVVEDSPGRIILRDNTPLSTAERRFGRFQITRPE